MREKRKKHSRARARANDEGDGSEPNGDFAVSGGPRVLAPVPSR